jgi:N-formylglutamate amidohydrolase
MDQETRAEADQAIEILSPARQTVPLVFSSPHSGRDYPAAFIAAAALDARNLRRSEDSFVDELFAHVPHVGAPLLKALFPRAYVDPNREPFELDPAMFAGRLPDFVNRRSPRVAAGLGTIARVVASGAEIYAGKLDFDEAQARIEALYRPYHAALEDLIATTRRQFGYCVLIDCHSMPSIGGPMEDDAGRRRQVDMILGDGHGSTCAPALTTAIETGLRGFGYSVVRNMPYSGGYITRNYGQPTDGVHAVQIEINRSLYMDETRYERKTSMAQLTGHLQQLCEQLAAAGDALVAA